MGFCEASEERNTHDNWVARLGHPLTQALHDWKQETFPLGCLQIGFIGVSGVIEVSGVVKVNGVLHLSHVLGLMLHPAAVPYLVCTLHLPLVRTSWPCCALLSICLLHNDTAVTLSLPCAIPADVG